MKAKLGMFAVQLSGSVGGTTAAKNRYGTYFKKKSHPINRKTSSQSAVRTFFSTLTKGWKNLTAPQRASWTMAVENFKKANSLAESIVLTGHQLYISLNRNLQSIGEALITSAPAVTTVTPVASETITAAAGAATMSMAFSPVIPVGQKMLLFGTRPLSAGKKSNSQDYKIIDYWHNGDLTPIDIKSAYELIYGTGWKTAGQQIFWKAIAISIATGESTVPTFSSTIVAA